MVWIGFMCLRIGPVVVDCYENCTNFTAVMRSWNVLVLVVHIKR